MIARLNTSRGRKPPCFLVWGAPQGIPTDTRRKAYDFSVLADKRGAFLSKSLKMLRDTWAQKTLLM